MEQQWARWAAFVPGQYVWLASQPRETASWGGDMSGEQVHVRLSMALVWCLWMKTWGANQPVLAQGHVLPPCARLQDTFRCSWLPAAGLSLSQLLPHALKASAGPA